ncbi:MAG: NADP-dependent phosphogluconate dehydrogenase [Candidatus Liptonbacteria bacterium]|nr:NADP-dependent phosphogluconate dehydrogenase [Candidatus Liptonbacteria bacterium]
MSRRGTRDKGQVKHYKNILRYQIQPRERITTSFWVKRPGAEMIMEEKDFSFDYKGAFSKELFVDAYERLLLDAISGNQTLFVSTEEIAASWKFIDPISRAWKKNSASLLSYAKKTLPISEELDGSGLSRKEIGLIGLGKMGKNMALRLLEKRWNVIAYDVSPEARQEIILKGGVATNSIPELVGQLELPRTIWLMVPAGKILDEVIFGTSAKLSADPEQRRRVGSNGLAALLAKGDMIIDGGNSLYEDSIRRAKKLKKFGISFLDAGVSGGPGGARNGACLMVGGEKSAYDKREDLFRDLAVSDGYEYVGKAGAGHFVKMIHNGIEYGMMQAIAEGFDVLRTADLRGLNPSTRLRASADKRGKLKYKFNLKKIAGIYNRGSVIESRLVGWLKNAFEEYGENLERISGSVGHTGEGEWTVKTAKKLGVPAKVIEDAFKFRVQSAKKPSYVGKILSALRNQFGGHKAK